MFGLPRGLNGRRNAQGAIGTWYAQVEVTSWDEARNTGQIILSMEEKCSSKKEAEKAAQRLLAEHAKYFSATHSVDANVFCDLECRGAQCSWCDCQVVATPHRVDSFMSSSY
jgi:hypothetical protein